ncbi:MAG TPA: four helix bundle protein [Saprospiraceae bacterium]|nr:four helix bundle protein [Saprospiraceae bacterium]
MRDHWQLRAFQLTDEVALDVYRISKDFPKDELYGLTSQIRRAAVSAASNIVEGCSRESIKEYLRFLEIAFGSVRELNYQWSLATRLDYHPKKEMESCQNKIIETEKVLGALVRKIRDYC